MNRFTTPVSMRVTEEQFEKDLEKPLKALGYSFNCITGFFSYPIITTNYNNRPGNVTNVVKYSKCNLNRFYIDHYNPQLFLALAAMTTDPLGIVGEWFVPTDEINPGSFTEGKLYRAKKPINELKAFIDNHGKESGFAYNYAMMLRKATKEELISKFTSKKEEKTMFKKDDYIVCLNTPEYGSNFPPNYIFKQRGDLTYISPYLDLNGSKSNGWIMVDFKGLEKYGKWRYATDAEAIEYERQGKPYDVTDLNKIGYKVPTDLYGGDVKAGEIYKQCTNKSFYEPINIQDKGDMILPKEIVETWEPVYKKEEVIVMAEGFELAVKDNKIIHKKDSTDITNYVQGIVDWWKNRCDNGAMSFDFDFKIMPEDIVITKTGCQYKSTTLKQWLDLAAKIK